ncbi:hypothetical protein CHARACLAT_003550 [Characodon lateralis]|uniref:Secreted protein n=1 Tax=Characodon lateralis TaxID=208331 RepID=A0ABU7DDD5_9TELE|nr:hypothetical protein [Characodon lateralis]
MQVQWELVLSSYRKDIPWLLSSSLDALFFVVPVGLGSSWALCTPPAERPWELMLDCSFPVSANAPPITEEITLCKLSAPATKSGCDLD